MSLDPVTEPTELAALYVRVSTADQSLEGQERELRLECERLGWEVGPVFAEKASASGRTTRAGFERLLLEAHHPDRKWRRVVVWSLDRWSREPSFVRAIGTVEELEGLGVRFHFVREPNLDTGEGEAPSFERQVLRGILPAIAAFESRRRSDRTLLALQEIRSGRRATRSGRPIGRPRKVTQDVLSKVEELRKAGYTWREVAQRLSSKVGTLRRSAQRSRRAPGAAQNSRPAQKGPESGE